MERGARGASQTLRIACALFTHYLLSRLLRNISKGWDIDEEVAPEGRDAKFSWEVIRDNSVFTYRIDLVPGYAEIMAALKASTLAPLSPILDRHPKSAEGSDPDRQTPHD